jgi:polysaccharide pyruvyl transferase WcaK-like protein
VKTINTVVGENNPAESIHQSFADAALVVTTRLHGSLLALHHNTPFVAIDQIEGGRKVTTVVRQLGWEHLYSHNVDESTLAAACQDILTDREIAQRVSRTAQAARDLSRRALQRSVDAILGDA